MLSRNSYPKEYVDQTRSNLAELTSAYRNVSSSAKDRTAIETLEPLIFNHMVLALDGYFCHRARGMEGKDGNPLNEVRVLCSSLMEGNGLLLADKQIKLDPAKSILGLDIGDEIQLGESDFSRLSEAFLDEIESRYP